MSLLPAATGRPFSKSAPVGQTWTHFPQLVQVGDSPHGIPMSVWTRVSRPRCMTSQVWAPSISSQTRTQRRQRMQRLWSIAKNLWLASMSTLGLIRGEVEVGQLQVGRQLLELAVVVGDADRADVVALHEDHLGHGLPVLEELLGVRGDLHALGDLRHAGRDQSRIARDLDHAQAAGAPVVDALEVAEARDVDPVLLGHVHDRLALDAGDVAAVDPERIDGRHAITSAGCSILQTPAGQTLSTMWAMYSSRK